MLPLAPGRTSASTCWPHDSVNFAPIMRVRMSDVPPAGYGTTTRIGLAGYCCAFAENTPNAQQRRKAEGGRRKWAHPRFAYCVFPSAFRLPPSALLLISFPHGHDRDHVHLHHHAGTRELT